MLRAVSRPAEGEAPTTVHASLGTAAVLGLEAVQMEVAPTTAYLMVGGRCAFDCAFCAQARSSTAPADRLSRVTWPEYPLAEVLARLPSAYARGAVRRACLQVTAGPGYAEAARHLARVLKETSQVPLCVSIRAADLALFEELLALGAERVTLALDAACEGVYSRVKGHDWARVRELLLEAARRYPGHVGTHLIAGLGETEADLCARLQELHDAGITIGLFAFTPVPGTALAGEPPPSLAGYRRVQAAHYLITRGHARASQFAFSAEGQVVSYGMDTAALGALLATGEAFQTSGCPGCNRPYYNERPGGPLYNYPRPLRPDEAAAAVALVLGALRTG